MINVVIPMAGAGSRFSKAGYTTPKPFIEASGKMLIQHVLDNLSIKNARYILLARAEHLKTQQAAIEQIKNNYTVTFIPIEKLTEGAVCTVLHAHRLINNDTPLLIANSDQYIEADINLYISDCQQRQLDGSILTFIDKERNPKWSFAKLNDKNLVSEVREKEAISEFATVGIYYYSHGKSFINAAMDMIAVNERVNNEFYICPTYNYCIANQERIGIFNIDADKMHGLGTPEDLLRFNEYNLCQ